MALQQPIERCAQPARNAIFHHAAVGAGSAVPTNHLAETPCIPWY